jgi:hypothetical protein
MHRYAAIEQARCELQSEQDRGGRKSTFSPTAKHLSHDTWRDTLAILRDTFIQRDERAASERRLRHTARFTSAVPNFS